MTHCETLTLIELLKFAGAMSSAGASAGGGTGTSLSGAGGGSAAGFGGTGSAGMGSAAGSMSAAPKLPGMGGGGMMRMPTGGGGKGVMPNPRTPKLNFNVGSPKGIKPVASTMAQRSPMLLPHAQ